MRLRRSARGAWLLIALIVGLAVAGVADSIVEERRLAREEVHIAELEAGVSQDPEVATELAALLEEQTARSLHRRERQQVGGVVLVVLSVLFLLAAPRGGISAGKAPATQATQDARNERLTGATPLTRRRSGPGATPHDTKVDLTVVDTLIERIGRGPEAAIPLLQAIQEHWRYLPTEALEHIARSTDISAGRLLGNASFYARFRREPVGRHVVRVCHGTACHVAGIGPVVDEMRRRLEIPPGADTDPAYRFTLEPVACLGCCSLAPVLMIGEESFGHLTPDEGWRTLRETEEIAEQVAS